MKKLISAMKLKGNESAESFGYLKTQHFDMKVRTTFSFHVLIERLWNEAKSIPPQQRKPLDCFLYDAIENNFSVPIIELSYIFKKIYNEFEDKPDKPLQISNLAESTASFLFIVSLCIGGGESGKKFLALLALRKLNLDHLIPKGHRTLYNPVTH